MVADLASASAPGDGGIELPLSGTCCAELTAAGTESRGGMTPLHHTVSPMACTTVAGFMSSGTPQPSPMVYFRSLLSVVGRGLSQHTPESTF